MGNEPKMPWYRSGGFVAGAGIASLMAIGLISASAEPSAAPSSASAQPVAAAAAVAAPSPTSVQSGQVTTAGKAEAAPVKAVPLSNDNYYTNVDGKRVHSPAYAPSVPPGASARCRDGTYSFSQNRRGTCSHHGGVAEWL